jgi:nucleoside-diphosphate-sugar epimerase
LLIGCGDVALRVADLLRSKVRLYGLTRRPDDVPRLRSHGVVPIVGDLDRLATLGRLRTAPFAVLHFAPPPADGRDDPRTRKLIAALARARSIPRRFVYVSTSGVYGDCAGARVTESRPRRAQTPRRRRRGPASRMGGEPWRHARNPPRAGHLRRNETAARSTPSRHACAHR